jgi:hypothetical protein
MLFWCAGNAQKLKAKLEEAEAKAAIGKLLYF